MGRMEKMRNRGIDQAHIADDRKHIETRRHSGGTTWDDLINTPYSGKWDNASRTSRNVATGVVSSIEQMKAILDSLPTDVDDEIKRAVAAIEAEQQAQIVAVTDTGEQALNVSSDDRGEEKVSEVDREITLEKADQINLPDNEFIKMISERDDVDQPENFEGRESEINNNQDSDKEISAFAHEEADKTTIEGITKIKESPNEILAEKTEEKAGVEAVSETDDQSTEEEKSEKIIKEISNTEEASTGQSVTEEEIKNSESHTEIDRQPNNIDDNVFRTLFGEAINIKNMLGEQQFSEWREIINQDINAGKYRDAKYEHGLVYYIGNVNSGSRDNRGNDWDIMKYRPRDERLKYDERVRSIDSKVWKQIGKTVYALGATLGDGSKEYHDAINKINQDIYNGRYGAAEYVAVRNEGKESEEGVIIFKDVANEEGIQEELVGKPETTEPEHGVTLDTQTESPEPTETLVEKPELAEASAEELFQGEMTNAIIFEVRKSVDTLKKIYTRLKDADAGQIDRFRYLYENLSAISKMKPLNKDEEKKKLDQIYAYKNLINRLYSELGEG